MSRTTRKAIAVSIFMAASPVLLVLFVVTFIGGGIHIVVETIANAYNDFVEDE